MVQDIQYTCRTTELACGITALREDPQDDNMTVLELRYQPRGGGRGWEASILTPPLSAFGNEQQIMSEKITYVLQLEAAIKEQYDRYHQH